MRNVLLLLLVVFCSAAPAQQYPNRPVRIVVPLSAGGFADTPARLLAPRLSAQFGRQFYIENRPGAGSTIGADAVAKAAPDGHTLLLSGTPHVISAHLYRNLPYDALKDFAQVSMVAMGPYVLVVNAQMPVQNVRELIALAKAQPGAIDYASSGNGSAQHLVSALFNAMAGIRLNHVPYKGSGPAMQDLVSGQVKVSFAGVPNVLSHLRAGRLRALAISTPVRWPELAEVPTVAEAGVPGYEATLWLNLAAPAGTPGPILQRLREEVSRALGEAEVKQQFQAAGVEATLMPPQALEAFVRAEFEKWGRVVRDTGASVN
jgi:tripartite-type tricarboxylate transporter receptor subunit TctC